MKFLYYFTLLIAILIVSGCTKSEYIRWSDTVEDVDTDRLEEFNIPYKIKDNKVYIPERDTNKAVMCCS